MKTRELGRADLAQLAAIYVALPLARRDAWLSRLTPEVRIRIASRARHGVTYTGSGQQTAEAYLAPIHQGAVRAAATRRARLTQADRAREIDDAMAAKLNERKHA